MTLSPVLFSTVRRRRQNPKANDDWETPPDIFEDLDRQFAFTLDAAASRHNSKLPRYWSQEDDALTKDWQGERIWLNPPYSLVAHFMKKAATEPMKDNDCRVVLVAARIDTEWWHRWVMPYAAEVWTVYGRIHFLKNGQKVAGAAFPSAIVIYEPGKRLGSYLTVREYVQPRLRKKG